MKKSVLFLSVSLLALCAGATKITFKDADKDKDGIVTKEEFVAEHKKVNPASPPEKVDKIFAAKDTNKDGKLTEEEFMSDR